MTIAVRLTNEFVESVTEAGYYRDTELKGFYLRVTHRQSTDGTQINKSFLVRAKRRGTRETVSVTVGRYNDRGVCNGEPCTWTVKKARDQALTEIAMLKSGMNVNEQRRQDLERERQEAEKRAMDELVNSVTLRQVFDRYVAERTLKPQTRYTYRVIMNSDLADWMDRPLARITADAVLGRHREISTQHKGEADNCMRILRAVFNFAAEEYKTADGGSPFALNPVKLKRWNNPPRRQTMIEDGQIRQWLEAVKALPSAKVRDLFLLLFFTGLRKQEGCCLRWKRPDAATEKCLREERITFGWVDFESRYLTIQEPKNSHPHYLPLTDVVYALLKRRQREALAAGERCEFVFPTQTKDTHISYVDEYVKKVEKESGVRWTLHDCRRTYLTNADEVGVSDYTIKNIANHRKSTDVTQDYIVRRTKRLMEPMNAVNTLLLEKAEVDLDWLLGTASTEAPQTQAI